jgi:FKBP-type peptidyl-prolyl cis-trans isomerase FkpA
MKNWIVYLCLAITSISCLKKENIDCNNVTAPAVPASEITQVQNYLTSQNIVNAIQHSSGLFYTINNAGTGATPNQCNTVAVKYTGKLTNGQTFDQQITSPASFSLSGLIYGWRIGIPLLKTGGSIRLYVPPSLGYGSQGSAAIPANSVLVFDIELVNVI